MDTQRWLFYLWAFNQQRPAWLMRLYALVGASLLLLGLIFAGVLTGDAVKAWVSPPVTGLTIQNIDKTCGIFAKTAQADWGANLLLGNSTPQLDVPLLPARYTVQVQRCDGTQLERDFDLRSWQTWVLP